MKVQNVIKIEPEDASKIRGIVIGCVKARPEDWFSFFAKAEEELMIEIQDLVNEAYRLGLEQGDKDED